MIVGYIAPPTLGKAASAVEPCAEVAYALDAVVAAVPKPNVVLAAAASASSINVAP